MTQPQIQIPDASSALPLTDAASSPALEVVRVGHKTPGLVVVQQSVDGVMVLRLLSPIGELQPLELTHSDSGAAIAWADLTVSTRQAAVSGWYPGKLGGWVKLDWRDGGFAADAWTSDGAGMTAYDAAMRAAKKRA